MIWFLNRKELFVDSSSEAAAQVWTTLKENGIPYEMRTKQNTTTLGKNIHYSMGARFAGGGMGGSAFADNPQYVYTIYVRKKDYEKAVELCHLTNK
ncbi:MAG: hypothetical protein J6D29_08405 [Solobacterium sp.]|nr:hypothetical protein [Solobacterium sp.]